jgi:hypothetical protein
MTTGVLSWADMRTAINLNTGFFETSQLDLDSQMRIIAGNWDGAGQSAGNLQYNWGYADRLTELYNHLLNNHDSVVRAVFGADTARYDEFRTVNLTYTRVEKITWGDSVTDPNNGHQLIEPWKTILGDLLVTPECKAKYFEMMDAYYVPDALDLFKQLSCVSRASLASLFDINVNRGRFYPCNTLQVDFDLIDANVALTDEEKEAQKIFQINVRGNDLTNAMDASASAFIPRRMGMANQGGDYYGSTYDPETQFDINQEPAISEKSESLSGIKIGELGIDNILLGTSPIQSIYLGTNLLDSVGIEPYVTTKVPNTQFRTNSNNYAGFEDGSVTLEVGQKLWIDVQNFVACRTYYTTDGTTPTINSPLYIDGLDFDRNCTLKALTVSVSGYAEVVRTLEISIATVPSNIGDLVAWYDAGDIQQANDTLVSLWSDRSGNNRDGVTSGTYQPTFKTNQVNGLPTLKFDWGGQTINAITSDWGVVFPQPLTVVFVGNYTGFLDSLQFFYDGRSFEDRQSMFITLENKNLTLKGTTEVNSSYQPSTTYFIAIAEHNSTASTLQINDSIVASGDVGTGGLGGISIGSEIVGLNGMRGNFAEFLIYSKALTSEQKETLKSYLAEKYNIAITPKYRYVRFQGHGDQTGITTRLVELQALEGATNHLLNKTPMAGYTAPSGGTIGIATDGAIVHSSGYPFWWLGEGIPDLIYDLGANYAIDTLKVAMYSPAVDPRTTQFKVYVSTDNTNWTLVADYSTNAVNQPEAGWSFAVPQG